MNLLLLGGTGFVGTYLRNQLSKVHTIQFTSQGSHESSILYNAENDDLSMFSTNNFDIIINNINPQSLSYAGAAKNAESLSQLVKNTSTRVIHVSSFFASHSNRLMNDYSLKKAIAEDILTEQLNNNQLTILRFPQLYDLQGFSRKSQGGLFYIAERIIKNEKIEYFSNAENCIRNYMPVDLLMDIMEYVIDNNITGMHNAFFDEFNVSFLEIIKVFLNCNPDYLSENIQEGEVVGMTYDIESGSPLFNDEIIRKSAKFYFENFYKCLNQLK